MVSDRMLVNVLVSYNIYWRNFGFSNYVERMNEQTSTSLWGVRHNGNFEIVKSVTVMLQGDPIFISKY
jgi:hypothetical protein